MSHVLGLKCKECGRTYPKEPVAACSENCSAAAPGGTPWLAQIASMRRTGASTSAEASWYT